MDKTDAENLIEEVRGLRWAVIALVEFMIEKDGEPDKPATGQPLSKALQRAEGYINPV